MLSAQAKIENNPIPVESILLHSKQKKTIV